MRFEAKCCKISPTLKSFKKGLERKQKNINQKSTLTEKKKKIKITLAMDYRIGQ